MNKMKMTQLKKIAFTVAIALGSLLFVYAVTINSNTEPTKNFPMKIDFAGEVVPTYMADVYERLDRELAVNTYWQSNTLKILKRAEKYFAIIGSELSKCIGSWNMLDRFFGKEKEVGILPAHS